MEKVYACLLGEWICLNDEPSCSIGRNKESPSGWWENNAEIYAPTRRTKEMKDSFYYQEYIEVYYKGKMHRIHPSCIQIVSE